MIPEEGENVRMRVFARLSDYSDPIAYDEGEGLLVLQRDLDEHPSRLYSLDGILKPETSPDDQYRLLFPSVASFVRFPAPTDFRFVSQPRPSWGQSSQYVIVSRLLLSHILVSVLAYGQTDSGKELCLFGNASEPGFISVSIADLFDRIDNAPPTFSFCLSLSCYMLYQDRLFDLFDLSSNPTLRPPVHSHLRIIPEDISRLGRTTIRVHHRNETPPEVVHQPTAFPLESLDHAYSLISTAIQHRQILWEGHNEVFFARRQSSTFVRLVLEIVEECDEGGGGGGGEKSWIQREGELLFVSLESSEKIRRRAGVGVGVGNTFRTEARMISQSLNPLGAVIHARARNSRHIPYRNSKLTQFVPVTSLFV